MDPFLERAKCRAHVGEWLWRVGALFAIVAAVLFLGACASPAPTASLAAAVSGGANSAEATAPSRVPPSFARCWNEPYNAVSTWTSWQGGDYVPCDETHTTYTFAVQNLPARQASAFSSALSASQSEQAETAARTQIREVAAEVCRVELEYLVPTRGDRYSLVTSFTLLPSDAEWRAGARWVRCDIGLLAQPTPRAPTELVPLPSQITDLALSVQHTPRQYEVCLAAPVSSSAAMGGPHTDGTKPARCDEVDAWYFLASVPLGYAPESAFPGGDALSQAASTACSLALDASGGYNASMWRFYPGEQGWADGQRTATCWIYRPQAP
jgi:hypothetical protein